MRAFEEAISLFKNCIQGLDVGGRLLALAAAERCTEVTLILLVILDHEFGRGLCFHGARLANYVSFDFRTLRTLPLRQGDLSTVQYTALKKTTVHSSLSNRIQIIVNIFFPSLFGYSLRASSPLLFQCLLSPSFDFLYPPFS